MTSKLPSAKLMLACMLFGFAIGFFVGGGWQIVFNFDEWRYGTFLHADGLELFCFLNWAAFGGPLAGAGLGALAGLTVSFIPTHKKSDVA